MLCARGRGNFSYRLYETLCSGRIPVFIDTDCVLPFEDVIDWRSLCVWVPEAEVDQVAERVADFHARLSPVELPELQVAVRQALLGVLRHHSSAAATLEGQGRAPRSGYTDIMTEETFFQFDDPLVRRARQHRTCSPRRTGRKGPCRHDLLFVQRSVFPEYPGRLHT